jgi:hypothetical protein
MKPIRTHRPNRQPQVDLRIRTNTSSHRPRFYLFDKLNPMRQGQITVSVVSCFGFLLVAILFFYAVSPWTERGVIPFLGSRAADTSVFAGIGLFTGFVAVQLFQGKRWAGWMSLAVSSAILILGIALLYSFFFPRDEFARSEGGGVWLLALILIAPSLTSVLLLVLPSTRQRFRSVQHLR